MITKYCVRPKNKEKFVNCIKLRKQGLSYSEIRTQVTVAKSTLNNWLTLANLTLGREHLEIQAYKRIENHHIATAASRIIRTKKRETEIQRTVMRLKSHFKDSLFISGIMLYEAEGAKEDSGATCFSNSDYRLVEVFIKFIENYFNLHKHSNMKFRIAIHESRKDDERKIVSFWVKKLGIPTDKIKIHWKKNIVTRRRLNPDYVGQMDVRISGESYLTRKLVALSDIILRLQMKIQYCGIV